MNNYAPELLSGKKWIIEKYISPMNHALKDRVVQLVLVSDYVAKHIELLLCLLNEDTCTQLLSREYYFHELGSIETGLSQAHFMQILRRFRHKHLIRIMLLELAGRAQTEEAMQSWSDCSDAMIFHALAYANQQLGTRYGLPRNIDGAPVTLYSIAMGKLGGRELNYSSDIDLIFLYSESGYTNGVESIANEHFFTKQIQHFVQIMSQVTEDGFVHRVDLRLRPNGESGPLVLSLSAMENYYQEQGRDWERYAMVKARVIMEELGNTPDWFSRLITPFVYRRYVDFSVIESLRTMKAMIEREIQLNPRLNDIKRGKGGIREVEFIIQNVQLIRGGRIPLLQQQNALMALDVLKQEHLLPRTQALKQAYLFLRRLENVIQGLNDQQTHSLPEEPVKQYQICSAMGFTSYEELLDKLHQYQRIISNLFHQVLAKVDVYEDKKRLLANQFSSIWQGHVEPTMASTLLTSLGFENGAHCYQMIHAFRHSPRCRRLSQAARIRLDRFMVLLLTELTLVKRTDKVLLNVMHLLENIVGRSAYLALLTEHTNALKELLYCFANSPFITSLFLNQPFLLEVLLDQDKSWRPIPRIRLEKMVKKYLDHAEDIEQQEELLRQFKLKYWLMAARAELYGWCDAVRIAQFLTDLAQVIVTEVLDLALTQLSVRTPEINTIASRFTIIAYGKLGSREMNYTSDLDLVFLHTVKPAEEALINRLTQKIMHMLTIRLQSGVLYAVDTRLRPSGSAGLLVSPMNAFIAYQKEHAWTWEHQALLKARVITGGAYTKKAFSQLKKDILNSSRDHISLHEDVLGMREKMEQHQEADPIKLGQGGLLDLEFLVQYLVLKTADPSLAKSTNTLNHLNQLYTLQVLNEEELMLLKRAYYYFHKVLHQRVIAPEIELDSKVQDDVKKVSASFLETR